MESLFVGVAKVTLYIRHSRSLKDRRSVTSSIRQKLINRGFSVTQVGDDTKHAILAFCCVGTHNEEVRQRLREGCDLFFGNFEVVSQDVDVFDYSYAQENPEYDDEKYGDRDE